MNNNCDYIIKDSEIAKVDADEIYQQAYEYLQRFPGKSTKDALEATLKNQAFDLLESQAIAKLNEEKAQAFLEYVKNDGSPVDYLVRRPSAKDQSYNVETFALNHNEDFNNLLRHGLSDAEEALLGDVDHEEGIIAAFDGAQVGGKYAKIAENMRKYFTARDTKLVTSTAFKHKQLLDDYYFRVTHDTSAISKVSASEWVNDVYGKLNEEKTARLMGIKPERLRETLFEVYHELESGVPLSKLDANSLLAPNVKGMAHRYLIFNDLSSQFAYNKKYGELKSLSELLHHDMLRSSKQIANAELLGNDPNNFVRNILRNDSLFKKYFDSQAFKAIYNAYYDTTPSMASPKVKGILDIIKTVTAIPRLFGALPFYSIADLPTRMLYLRNSGAQVWEAVIAPFVNFANKATPEEVELLRHYVDTFFAESFYNRSGFTPPKFLDKASKLVYHGFGLKTLERNQMKGLIAFKCRQLGQNAPKTFNQLDEGLKSNLTKHGIDDYEWDLIRASSGKTGYITPDQINDLEVSSDIKLDLRRKLRSLFVEAANNAILSNGMYENALYSMGTRAGTILGECVRAVMQFKSFGLNFLSRVIVGQYKNAVQLDRRLETAIFFALTSIPLNYASDALLSISKGMTPSNPFEGDTREQIAHAESLLLGNLGALMTVIDPTGNKSLIEKLMSSPLTKAMNSIWDSFAHPTHIPKNVEKLLNLDGAPFISTVLRVAFNNMGLEELAPEPYKDKSQEFFI